MERAPSYPDPEDIVAHIANIRKRNITIRPCLAYFDFGGTADPSTPYISFSRLRGARPMSTSKLKFSYCLYLLRI